MVNLISLHDLHDLLELLYDPAGLDSHPLAERLASAGTDTQRPGRGHQTRELLLQSIEDLKPPSELISADVEWRRYLVLHERYVRRRPLRDLEEMLALSDRQVRRVHHEALAALAALLNLRLGKGADIVSSPASVQLAAIERLSPKPRTFEVAAVLERAVLLLARSSGPPAPRVAWEVQPKFLTVHTDPGILHQLLIRLLRLLASRQGPAPEVEPLMLKACRHADGSVAIQFAGNSVAIESGDEQFVLCLALAHSIAAELTQDSGVGATGSIELVLPASTRARRILIVDDDPPAIELFTSYLQGQEYQVIGETSAEQALERAAEIQPAVIVLDVMMPGMDGWELLQRLHHTPQLHDVPIIACSVLDDAGLAFAVGAARYLKKPVLRQHLLTALAELMETQVGQA